MGPSWLLLLVLVLTFAKQTSAACNGATMPPLSDFKVGQFQMLYPGGDTICGKGSPFSFLVRRGSSNKVLVEFLGGGACWDFHTCTNTTFATVSPLFSFIDCQIVIPDVLGQTLGEDALIFDDYIADWTVVMVPYCTQDLHFGNRTTKYTDDSGTQSLTFHHVGAVNNYAVLSYLFRNVPSPEMVVVAGCSAGSLGVVMASSLIREHYSTLPQPPAIAVFPDSEFGLITPHFTNDLFPLWGTSCLTEMMLRPYFDLQSPDFWKATFTMEMFWDAAVRRASTPTGPASKWFVYSTTQDGTQRGYYDAMGGQRDGFESRMVKFVQHLAGLKNVRVWASAGTTHCTLAGSVAMTHPGFREWLIQGFNATLSNTTPMPDNNICDTCFPSNSPGCDGVVGSGLVYDECGVCGGQTTTCTINVPSWVSNSSSCDYVLSSVWGNLLTTNNAALVDSLSPLGSCFEPKTSIPLRAFQGTSQQMRRILNRATPCAN